VTASNLQGVWGRVSPQIYGDLRRSRVLPSDRESRSGGEPMGSPSSIDAGSEPARSKMPTDMSGARGATGSHAIRFLVGALLVACVALAVLVGVPTTGNLPSVALRQTIIYRSEIGLAAFYGGLLILLPAYRGIIDGRLPTAISPRGAEFATEVDKSLETTQRSVDDLQATTESLDGRMARARLNIDQLASKTQTALRD
jgi:hypothetical protein